MVFKNFESVTTAMVFNPPKSKDLVFTTWKIGSTHLSYHLHETATHSQQFKWNVKTATIDSPLMMDNDDNKNLNKDEIIKSYNTSQLYYNSVLTKESKIYILYRNPLKRMISAFTEDFINLTNNNQKLFQITGESEIKKIFLKVCKDNGISEQSEQFSDWVTLANKFRNDLYLKTTPEYYSKGYKQITKHIIEYVFMKYVKSNFYWSNHNSPWLSFVLRYVNTHDVNYSLIDIDEININDFLNTEYKYFRDKTSKEKAAFRDKSNRTDDICSGNVNEWILKLLQDKMAVHQSNHSMDNEFLDFIWNLKNENNIYEVLKSDRNNYNPEFRL